MIRLSLVKRLREWGRFPLDCDVVSKDFDSFSSSSSSSSVQVATPSSTMGMFSFVLMIGLLQLVAPVAQSAPQIPSCDTNNGHFGGTVFRDYNSDGTFDVNELGFGTTGMQVNAYDASNTVLETATVANDGKYVFTTLTNATDYRLEISGLPTYLQSTAEGANADANVRFVNTVSCNLDFGVHNPAQFCETNPSVATTCFVNGDPDEASAPADTIVAFNYDGSNKAAIGFKADTGTTWGVAYDSKRDQLYTAAVLRRHAGMGPAGAGGIYSISAPASVAPGIAAEFYNLTDFSVNVGAVPDNTARGLNGLVPTQPNHDSSAFPLIGKVGLGDLEISNDGNTLYVTNLADKKIYTIDLENPSVAPNTLPDFPATSCDNGEARPWALKVHDDKLYLGVVCSAEDVAGTAVDLDAYVYAYNGASWSIAINNFALDYPREKVVNSPISLGEWTPWRDTVADFSPPNLSAFGKPTPILSDIEFDDHGNMILGFTDRTGLQFGALNWGTDSSDTSNRYQIASGGDILKATPNNDGTYTVENITVADQEFYNQDFIAGKHNETAQGGLAVLPGSNQVMTVGMDPLIVNTGGVYWFNTLTGTKDDALELYKGRAAEGLSGKAVGLGDLELMCQSAPLEVGNRLWCDSNSDGIQTPGEVGVGTGIDVTMTCGIEFATIQTDANGKYLFTDVNWAASANTTSTVIPRDAACTIDVDYSSVSGTIASACSYSTASPAGQNADSDSSNSSKSDLRDSDATDTGTLASISFTTGQAGENNHSLDIGFVDGAVVASEDFGDAPDGLYATLLANNGPRHTLDPALYLGTCVDDETDGQQSTLADGDDTGAASANTNGNCATTNDDEDSLTPPSLTDSAVAPTVDVTVVNTTSADATVACWIDYDGDGAFENATERGSNTIGTSGTVTISFPNVPATASSDTGGSTFMRCRTASLPADVADATGAAANGEIEDYLVTVNATPVVSVDYGDAPSADYPTLNADIGPSHNLDPDLYLGACIDDEANGQPSATANGDDNGAASINTNGTCATANDDEDSLTPPSLTDGVAGSSIDVAVSNTTSADAYLACWIDYSGTGFEVAERSATVVVAANATTASVTLPDVPATASNDTGGSSFLRCRLASIESEIDEPTGAAANGEIEDYPVTINAIPVFSLDFGDAPSADYPTLSADNGPRHVLDLALYLGTCVDDEANGQPSATADGDDNGAASANTNGTCATPNDDEDSLTPPLLSDGQTAPNVSVAVTNTTGSEAYLACWVDYSGTGFEAGERSVTVVVADNATTATVTLPDVPATASIDTGGSSFLRCRIASIESEIANPTGAATTGEIEDYKLTIDAGNAGVTGVVWFDTDKDGIKDPDENGLPGWTIEIIDSNGIPVQSLTTLLDGTFSDLNLGTGDFTIRFLSPGRIIIKEQNITLNPGDVAFVPEPIDPAGIIYDEQTGDPVPGAQVFLTTDGTPVPAVCLGAGEQGQVTSVDGAYMFFLNPGADLACPAADTVYGIQVIPPANYQTTVVNPPQPGVLDADNCTIDAVAGITCEVSDQILVPITGIPPYYLLIDIGVGDPGVFNNHIPLTPLSVVAPPPTPSTPVKPIPTLSEWGRILLMLLIGVMTVMQHGRRRREI